MAEDGGTMEVTVEDMMEEWAEDTEVRVEDGADKDTEVRAEPGPPEVAAAEEGAEAERCAGDVAAEAGEGEIKLDLTKTIFPHISFSPRFISFNTNHEKTIKLSGN